jgi:thioredoxin 1
MAAEEGQVISVHTVESWKEQIQKGNDSKKLVQFIYLRSSSS